MKTMKSTFTIHFLTCLLTLLVAQGGVAAQADVRSCQDVFQSAHHQMTLARDTRGMNELTELLRRAGLSEFKEGREGINLLERTAHQNPEGFRYYIRILKSFEKRIEPKYPQDIVHVLERLMLVPTMECRGGNCTSSVKTKHSCAQGSCDSRLIEESSLAGEPQLIFQYQEVINLFGQPLRIWMSEPVTTDHLTGALTPKGIGVRAVNDIIQAAQSRSSPTAFVFIDVNDLSKVNYFKNGFLDGDAYIRAVGAVLKRSLRPGDSFVRLGGDEFVLILDRISPEDVQTLSQRLIHAVAHDPTASLVFDNQWKFIEQTIAEIGEAREMKDLGEDIQKMIWAQKDEFKRRAIERNRNPLSFEEFRSDAVDILKMWLLKQKTLLASNISIGSTFVRPGDNLDSVAYRASCNANLCKKTHKEALGADSRKYGGAPENAELILQNALSGTRPLPQALLPDHLNLSEMAETTAAEKPSLSLEDLYR